jgi:hypothetical protein
VIPGAFDHARRYPDDDGGFYFTGRMKRRSAPHPPSVPPEAVPVVPPERFASFVVQLLNRQDERDVVEVAAVLLVVEGVLQKGEHVDTVGFALAIWIDDSGRIS